MEYQLTTPIQAHDEEIKVLELKEPNTKMARKLGLPYRYNSLGLPEVIPEAAARYIVEMASIPSSSVDEISISDFNDLCMVVVGFFINSVEEVKELLRARSQSQTENQ